MKRTVRDCVVGKGFVETLLKHDVFVGAAFRTRSLAGVRTGVGLGKFLEVDRFLASVRTCFAAALRLL